MTFSAVTLQWWCSTWVFPTLKNPMCCFFHLTPLELFDLLCLTYLTWYIEAVFCENRTTVAFPLFTSVFFPLSLLSHEAKIHTHTDTLRLFISLSLTLQPGILEFGCWFSMENFNGESSCAWSIWWESVILHCQTSQACSTRYNICSTKQHLNGFSVW